MPVPWVATPRSSSTMDSNLSASPRSLSGESSHASPLRQSFEDGCVASSTTLRSDSRRRILTHQEAQLEPPEDHAQRLERMLSSQSLCDLEETIKRCRMRDNFNPEIMAVLERAITTLDIKSVETASCSRLGGRAGGAYSPQRLASTGLRFTQQGSMLARLDKAAVVDPQGAAAQCQLEMELADAAQEAPIKSATRSRRLSTRLARALSEEWVDVEAELRKDFVYRRRTRN